MAELPPLPGPHQPFEGSSFVDILELLYLFKTNIVFVPGSGLIACCLLTLGGAVYQIS